MNTFTFKNKFQTNIVGAWIVSASKENETVIQIILKCGYICVVYIL